MGFDNFVGNKISHRSMMPEGRGPWMAHDNPHFQDETLKS